LCIGAYDSRQAVIHKKARGGLPKKGRILHGTFPLKTSTKDVTHSNGGKRGQQSGVKKKSVTPRRIIAATTLANLRGRTGTLQRVALSTTTVNRGLRTTSANGYLLRGDATQAEGNTKRSNYCGLT